MRLDRIGIVLRPRTPWEAMDLGLAMARRHAASLWTPWLLLGLPFLVATNLLAWSLDRLWLAPLLMWWLNPLFERAPLYVLSRAVFGEAPGWRQTLRAPEVWRWGSILSWLSWRRLHPSRALLLPVDLLENLQGERRRRRAEVLQRAVSGPAWGLMLACLVFQLVMLGSLAGLALLLVPWPLLDSASEHLWRAFIAAPPTWAQLVRNLCIWLATSAIGPLFVAAGFGLYLNRRTQLEAWDVELAFRRLAERVRQVAALPLLLMALACAGAMAPSPSAAADKVVAKGPAQPMDARRFLGQDDWRRPDPAFADSVRRAYQDRLIAPHEDVTRWQFKYRPDPSQPEAKVPRWVQGLQIAFALVSEWGLWLLAALALGWLLWRLPRWLPWVRERITPAPEQTPIHEHVLDDGAPLPDDVAGAADALWQGGQRREALALLYRASVAAVADRLGVPFPPGATEAECLRRARRLPEPARVQQFAQIVRAWQAAAYAWRFPEPAAFADLLAGWRREFGSTP